MTTLDRARFMVRLLLGGLFVWAGLLKLLDPGGFAQAIANYRLLPEVLVSPVAILLPGVEVSAGLALISGRGVRGAIVVLEALLLVFVVALVQAILRGIDASCGCFSSGADTTPLGWDEVIRDVVLMACGAFVWPGLTLWPFVRRDSADGSLPSRIDDVDEGTDRAS